MRIALGSNKTKVSDELEVPATEAAEKAFG
jgi:hypothetical protein